MNKQEKNVTLKSKHNCVQWLTPVIPATQEVEIRGIAV
jgi:hypothetical protein